MYLDKKPVLLIGFLVLLFIVAASIHKFTSRSTQMTRDFLPRKTYRPDNQPWPVPGKIEAENFDYDAPGDPAYFDRSPGSEAPDDQHYRKSDVDLGVDHLLDLVDVGWISEGEWMEYTIDVMDEGNYRVSARIATPLYNRIFSLYLDGIPLSGPIAIPRTGCWGSDLKGHHCFQLVACNVRIIEKGVHRLRFDAGTGGYTLDWFQFLKL